VPLQLKNDYYKNILSSSFSNRFQNVRISFRPTIINILILINFMLPVVCLGQVDTPTFTPTFTYTPTYEAVTFCFQSGGDSTGCGGGIFSLPRTGSDYTVTYTQYFEVPTIAVPGSGGDEGTVLFHYCGGSASLNINSIGGHGSSCNPPSCESKNGSVKRGLNDLFVICQIGPSGPPNPGFSYQYCYWYTGPPLVPTVYPTCGFDGTPCTKTPTTCGLPGNTCTFTHCCPR